MKIIESLRNFFTKKNIKELCKKIWGKEPEPVDESVFDDPDRYVKFDEWQDKQYWEDKKRYKREKRLLTLRRFCVSVILIFLLTGLIKSVNLFVKSNAFLSCAGRDVCIYLGPKMNYPLATYVNVFALNNGDALTFGTGRNVDYFDIKKNKFIKINSLRHIPLQILHTKFGDIEDISTNSTYAMFENTKGNIAMIDASLPLEIFDVKNKKFITTNLNTFNQKNNKNVFIYLSKYMNNLSLVMSNNSRVGIRILDYGFRSNVTKPEKLYLFNNDDYSLKEMPSFAIPLKYFPRPSDIIVLNNGKIIMPIRYKYIAPDDRAIMINRSKAETDHIEIYDPVQNKFIAETNKDILEDNILHIVQPNNDVIFINKNSTYLFINKDNKFIKANEELTRRNQQTVEKLAKLMFEHMGLDIEEIFGVERARVVQLAPKKFLITCDQGHTAPFGTKGKLDISIKALVRADLNTQEKIQACRNTVYYDYEKNIVQKGPKFVKPHFYAKIEQLTSNLFIVVGGIDRIYYKSYKDKIFLGEYVQFIKVKN